MVNVKKWYEKWSKKRAKAELTKIVKISMPVTVTFSIDPEELGSLVEQANRFYYAYDKKIGKRVAHVFRNGYLLSLVTGTKFKFKLPKEVSK